MSIFRGKNKKLIHIGLIASILLFVIASLVTTTYFSSSKNLKTNLGKAQTSNYPITGAQLVEKAVTHLGQGYDCSGLVNKALSDCGATANGDSAAWNDGYFKYNFNGTDFGTHEIGEYTSDNGVKSTWYSKIANVNSLPIGTVISGSSTGSGRGHVFIYIGKANSYEALQKKLKSEYNITLPDNDGNTDKFDIREIGEGTGKGGEYWYIEGNSGGTVRIRNFNWYVKNDNDVKNLKFVKVWKVTESPSGSYQLNIVKKDTANKTGLNTYDNAIGGAKFEVKQYKNKVPSAGEPTSIATVTTNKGNSTTPIVFNGNREVKIDRLDVTDTYRIEEIEAPAGYKKIQVPIQIDVRKAISNDKYVIKSVIVTVGTHTAELTPGGRSAVQFTSKITTGGNEHRYTKDYISKDYLFGVDISTGAITVTWRDPQNEKDVDVQVQKKNAYGNNVKDVRIQYWVLDNANAHPKEGNGRTPNYSSYSYIDDGNGNQIASTLTIGKMKPGDTKYVWITEVNNNPAYGSGFFDTTDLQNTTRYIHLKVSLDANGKVSYSPVTNDCNTTGTFYLCQIKENTLTNTSYMPRNCDENEYIDPTDGITKYYVDTDKFKIDDLPEKNPTIVIPIVNPEKEYDYDLYIGKKSTKDQLSIIKENLIEGAEFSIRSGVRNGAANAEQVLSGEVTQCDSKSGTVTSKAQEYVSLKENGLVPTLTATSGGFNGHLYEITETKAPTGFELPSHNTHYLVVKFGDLPVSGKASIEDIEVYANLNDEGNLANKINVIGTETEDAKIYQYIGSNYEFLICITKDEDGNFTQIYFVMEDEYIPTKYNLNIAKIDKSDIQDYDLDKLNTDQLKQKFVPNVTFNVSKSRLLNNDDYKVMDANRIITTKAGDYTNVYSDVEIDPNSVYDKYVIHERSVPGIFEKYSKDIYIYVSKELAHDDTGNEYWRVGKVDIEIDANGDGIIDYTIDGSGEYWDGIKPAQQEQTRAVEVTLPDHILVDECVYLAIDGTDPTNTNITLILGDERIEKGTYNLQIVKTKKDNSQDDNYQSSEHKYLSELSDATFGVTQELNGSGIINSLSDVVTEEGTISNITGEVNITEAGTDTYIITEKSAPPGFNLENFKLKISVNKTFAESENKKEWSIENLNITGENIPLGYDSTINKGECLYISNNNVSKTFFESYILAVGLEQNSETGMYNILITWRNEKTTYDITLFKEDATKDGQPINGTATFDIKLYSDESLQAEAEFINKDGESQNKEHTTLTDGDSAGSIKIKDILMPEIVNESKTYYLILRETAVSNSEYKMVDGVLVIPLIFSRNDIGIVEVAQGEAYLIDNITDKNKIENGIENAEIEIDTNSNIININFSNVKQGAFTLNLFKYGTSSTTSPKRIDGAKFTIKITKEDGSIVYQSTKDDPDITGQNGNQGTIEVDAGKVAPGDVFKINIIEIDAPTGWVIPEELKEENGGANFTAEADSNLQLQITDKNIDNTSVISADLKFYNSYNRMMVIVNEPHEQTPGAYKINLVKKGTDGNLLQGVTFHRDATIRYKDNTGDNSEDNINIKYNNDITPTNANGEASVTLGMENDDGDIVSVPTENYSLYDIYNLSEISVGTENEGKYYKFPEHINLKVKKGYADNTAYANSFYLTIGEDERKINLLTGEGGNEQSITITDESGEELTVTMNVQKNEETKLVTVTLTVEDPGVKSGKYNFKLTKTDVSGDIIESEKTTFDVNVYSQMTESNGKVTFSTPVTLKDESGNTKKTTELKASTGVTTGLDGIAIQKEDIGKTYYFVTTETEAPDKHTEIYYKVVVPITYSQEGTKYIATKGEAFAVTLDGTKKELSDMSTDTNECVSTEQTDVTINVKVPNIDEVKRTVTKIWDDQDDKEKIRPESIQVQLNANGKKYEAEGVTNPVTLNEDNGWTYTWDNNLPKKANGVDIFYEVVEIGEVTGYTTARAVEGDTTTITNTHDITPGTYSIYINKVDNKQRSISGAYFKVSGKTQTNETILEEKTIGPTNGLINMINGAQINADNKDIVDKYTISEVKVENPLYQYYKMADSERIILNVHKTSVTSESGEVKYKLDYVEIEGGTTNSEGVSQKDITLENGTTLTASASNTENSVFITIPNEPKDGSYKLQLIKYGKDKDTLKPLSGVIFNLIGGTVNGHNIQQNDGRTYISETNPLPITTQETPVNIWGSGSKIAIQNATTDSYTLKEADLGSNIGYSIGFDENIKVTINKTQDCTIESLGLFINDIEVTTKDSSGNLIYTKTTQDGKTISITLKLEGDVISLIVENPSDKPDEPHKGVKEVYNQDSGYDKDQVQDWVITTKIPNGIDKYGKYIITDPIDERLVFSGLEKVRVSVVDNETLNKTKDLAKDTEYKLSYDNETRILKVSFIEGDFKGGQKLTPGDIVEIRFNTTFALNEKGNIIALNQSVPNQAELTYGDGNGNEVSLETEEPEVHTGGVGIYKYDAKTGNALSGAKFKIATSLENAQKGEFVKDATGTDIEIVTNEKGIGIFEGLEFGEDAIDKVKYKTGEYIYGQPVYAYDWEKVETTYYIVETESPEGYYPIKDPIEAVVKKDNYNINDITTLIQVGNEPNVFDLSLRKFITAVKDGSTGKEEEVTTRIPKVDTTKLANGTSKTATYTHPKDPVLVHTTDTVTYTIRVFNEGPQDAYASLIKDDIPEGLEFVQYTDGDGSINDKYRWKLLDENDNEVTDISKAKYIVSDYLSKENEKTAGENLLKAFVPSKMEDLDYRDVQVQFKVTEPTTSDRILINYAQISKETDLSGQTVVDRDSKPNVWNEGEDDQDIEKVKVLYFDLALRKWVTEAIVTENGKTVVTKTGHKAEDNPEDVVKVDLKKSKLNKVTVKFRYSIRITNQGEIAGEATQIRDDIPQGLKFVAEDNPYWREENGQVVTDKLAGTILQPGESAEVEILLTWVNSKDNMGVMINTAEINKDHNDYGVPDIDSTPGNNVPKEDDIDDAPVMLTVKTGNDVIMYTSLGLSVVTIIGVGTVLIRKRVL